MYKQAIVNNLVKLAWTVSPGALLRARQQAFTAAKYLAQNNTAGAANALRGPRLPVEAYNSSFGYNGFSPTKPNNIFMRFADNLHNTFLLAKARASGVRAGTRYGKTYPNGRAKYSRTEIPASEIDNLDISEEAKRIAKMHANNPSSMMSDAEIFDLLNK